MKKKKRTKRLVEGKHSITTKPESCVISISYRETEANLSVVLSPTLFVFWKTCLAFIFTKGFRAMCV